MIDRVRRKTTAVVAGLTLLTLMAMAAPAAAQGPTVPPLTVPVVGSLPGGGTFAGTFALTRFAVENGQVVARGVLAGVLTSATGVVTNVVSLIESPIAVTQATCEILHLDVGPIFLDLLGLEVDLSQIVLNVAAQSGAGNLLGNLLCTVAGLLDGNPFALARTLNRVLGVLGSL